MTLRQRVRGDEPIDEDVMWPKNWPLPHEGNTVLGDSIAGFVERTEFDLVAQRILVILR